jgi:hypothetical protein
MELCSDLARDTNSNWEQTVRMALAQDRAE